MVTKNLRVHEIKVSIPVDLKPVWRNVELNSEVMGKSAHSEFHESQIG